MRYLRGAMIATVLLGCNEDKGPVQPDIESASSATGQSGTGESPDALTAEPDIRPTRGFYVLGFPTGGSETISTTGLTEIQTMSLPAGKYIANASAVLATNEAEPRLVDCFFTINGAQQGESGRGMVGGTGRDAFTSLPMTIGFSIDAASNLGVACITEVESVVFSQASPITAIRLDRLTVYQP
jgi:hypothetical protein